MSDARTAQIPGDPGLSLLGHTLARLRAPIGTPLRMRDAHGEAFRHHILFACPVVFAHPDALGPIGDDRAERLSTAAAFSPAALRAGELIARRRASPSAADLLGQLCQATEPQGNRFTEDEIIDHTLPADDPPSRIEPTQGRRGDAG